MTQALKVFTHSLALCHLKISYIIHRWDSSYDISDTNFFLIAKLWENKKSALKIQWCGKPYHYFMKKEEPLSLLDPTQALTLLQEFHNFPQAPSHHKIILYLNSNMHILKDRKLLVIILLNSSSIVKEAIFLQFSCGISFKNVSYIKLWKGGLIPFKERECLHWRRCHCRYSYRFDFFSSEKIRLVVQMKTSPKHKSSFVISSLLNEVHSNVPIVKIERFKN